MLIIVAAVGLTLSIPLVTFDGAPGTTFKFYELNDPVMGGRSSGNWSVSGSTGVFQGTVRTVPSLSAPGFITAAADGKFADASAATANGALQLELRSSTSQYSGYRVSFASGSALPSFACAGGGSLPVSRGCFKANFSFGAAAPGYWYNLTVPFSDFTDLWSPATGAPTKTCAQDKSACVTAEKLKHIQRMQVWGEGVNGDVKLEIRSISAVMQP